MYKVTFKGDRQPEELNDEAGAKLFEARKSGNLPAQVQLRPGLLVLSSTIKDIEYIRQQEKRVYSKSELEHFGRTDLAEFLNKDGFLTSIGEIMYYQSKGLLYYNGSKDDVYAQSYLIFIRADRTKDYLTEQDKVQQFKFLKGRKYYAQKQEAAELDSVVSR